MTLLGQTHARELRELRSAFGPRMASGSRAASTCRRWGNRPRLRPTSSSPDGPSKPLVLFQGGPDRTETCHPSGVTHM